jgi:hypothetical protein
MTLKTNPKSEIRNSKQIPLAQLQDIKKPFGFGALKLFRNWCLGFMICGGVFA